MYYFSINLQYTRVQRIPEIIQTSPNAFFCYLSLHKRLFSQNVVMSTYSIIQKDYGYIQKSCPMFEAYAQYRPTSCLAMPDFKFRSIWLLTFKYIYDDIRSNSFFQVKYIKANNTKEAAVCCIQLSNVKGRCSLILSLLVDALGRVILLSSAVLCSTRQNDVRAQAAWAVLQLILLYTTAVHLDY